MHMYMVWIWLAVILITFFIEAVSMDLLSIWFTFGAFVALIVSLFTDVIIYQTVVFFGVATILLIFTRPLAKKYFKVNKISTNADRVIGKVAIVSEKIESGLRGAVLVDGKEWTAISNSHNTLKKGDKVEVLAIEGVKLLVTEIINK